MRGPCHDRMRRPWPVQRSNDTFEGFQGIRFLFAFASLFADISTEMLYPVLVFLTQTLKASGSIVGLVDGFAQATQSIVQGFSGALSDKLQKRNPSHWPAIFGGGRQAADGFSADWQGVFGARLLDRLCQAPTATRP